MIDQPPTKEWLQKHGGIVSESICPICGNVRYEGAGHHPWHRLSGYDIVCCTSCYKNNWDGWVGINAERILAMLKEKGVEPPPRNEKGWLPLEF